jgi:hypothetical protein
MRVRRVSSSCPSGSSGFAFRRGFASGLLASPATVSCANLRGPRCGFVANACGRGCGAWAAKGTNWLFHGSVMRVGFPAAAPAGPAGLRVVAGLQVASCESGNSLPRKFASSTLRVRCECLRLRVAGLGPLRTQIGVVSSEQLRVQVNSPYDFAGAGPLQRGLMGNSIEGS